MTTRETAPLRKKKRKKPTSTTVLTKKYCEARGIHTTKVERHEHFSRTTNDAFGFGDILAMDGGMGALLIQCTTLQHLPDRVAKIIYECTEYASEWLMRGNRIVVIGWSKRYAIDKPPQGRFVGARERWMPTFQRIGVDSQGLFHVREYGLVEPQQEESSVREQGNPNRRPPATRAANRSGHADRPRVHRGARRGAQGVEGARRGKEARR